MYLRAGAEFEDYPSGWTSRYITDLQAPVAFYLRGEEYSAQIDAFVDAVERGRPRSTRTRSRARTRPTASSTSS